MHPTNLSPEDGELFNVPVALIPSGGEDAKAMDAIWETLMKKDFKDKCLRKDFVSLFYFWLGWYVGMLTRNSWIAIMDLRAREPITMILGWRRESRRRMRS